MKKLLLVVPIVALLAAGCNSSQQTNNSNSTTTAQTLTSSNNQIDMSDWKTYSNQIYNFQFKYPSNWSVNDYTYTYQGQSYPSVAFSSPAISGVPGASRDANFYTLIYKENGSWQHKEHIDLSLLKSDGGALPVNVSQQYLQSRPEYSIALAIFASVKTSTPTSAINANLIVQGLQSVFTKQGFTMDNSNSSNNMFWLDNGGLYINVNTPYTLSFEVTKSAPQDYDVYAMQSSPELSPVIKVTDNYMASQGFTIQQNQSTTQNQSPQTFTYTHAYYNSQNNLRCRLGINDPYSGVGEVPPFTFVATVSCLDNQQYTVAFNSQAPILQALAPVLNSPENQKYKQMMNPDFNQVCTKDPSIKLVSLDAVDGTSAGWVLALQCSNGTCTNMNFSSSQVDGYCH